MQIRKGKGSTLLKPSNTGLVDLLLNPPGPLEVPDRNDNPVPSAVDLLE